MRIKTIWLVPFIVFGLFLAVILSFSYFQQDEWHAFGVIQSYGFEYVTGGKSLFASLLSDRIGARAITYGLFKIFDANPVPYGIFAAIVHLLNSFLIFQLAHKITKNKTIAALASLFFMINSVGSQAYSWFGTMAGSATSVTFILLSLIFYFNFLSKRKYIDNFLSLLFLWVSFLFKEVGYFLFIVYPLLWFIYVKNKSLKLFIKDNLLVFIYGVVITVFLVQSVLFIPGIRANYIVPQASGFVKVFMHLILYPLEGISQVILPSSVVFDSASLLTRFIKPSLQENTPSFDLYYTTVMAEYVSVAMSIMLIIILIIIYKKFVRTASENLRLLFLGSTPILIFSFLPYVAIDKFDAYLDLRHYYSTSIGAALLVGIIACCLFSSFQKIKKRKILFLAFIFLFFYHGLFLVKDKISQLLISRERINIISEVKKIAPTLPSKTVFFVTGDSPGYYALPELKVPFQSGFGQVLMTLYAKDNPVYSLLFKEKTYWDTADGGFLYDTLSQGYREINGKGFGYYYNRKDLERAINEKLFNKESVVSLFYNSDEKKIRKLTIAEN